MKIIADKNILKDQQVISFDFSKLDKESIKAFIEHEMLHILELHPERVKRKPTKLDKVLE